MKDSHEKPIFFLPKKKILLVIFVLSPSLFGANNEVITHLQMKMFFSCNALIWPNYEKNLREI